MISSDAASPPLPAAAATVLMLRDSPSGGLEVLMQRRRQTLSFMGGKWVFPGGRVDASDADPATLARVAPEDTARCRGRLRSIAGNLLNDVEALAIHVAACRETFEEVGILLARRDDGRPVDPATVARLQDARERVVSAPHTFAQLLQAEHLLLEVGRLVYWAHWITPRAEATRRFDTRFFAISVPLDQVACCDGNEATESKWISPDDALDANARGEMSLVPPTLFSLEDLRDCNAQCGPTRSVLAAEAARTVPPVTPRVVRDGDHSRIVMPWHAEYLAAEGDGTPATPDWPVHVLRRRASLPLRPDFGVASASATRPR